MPRAYIEQHSGSAAMIKQHMAAIFDHGSKAST